MPKSNCQLGVLEKEEVLSLRVVLLIELPLHRNGTPQNHYKLWFLQGEEEGFKASFAHTTKAACAPTIAGLSFPAKQQHNELLLPCGNQSGMPKSNC